MRPFDELTARGRVGRLRRLAIDVLERHYAMRNASVRLLAAHSFNTMFRVDHAGERFVLRVGDACRIHVVGVEDVEAWWLRELASAGLAVSRNVPSISGCSWVAAQADGVDGERACSLFTFMEGRSLREVAPGAPLHDAGALLARLHETATHFDHGEAGDAQVLAQLEARRVVTFHEENLVVSWESPYGSLFVEAVERVQNMLDALWASRPHEPHLLHGDMGPHNLLRYRGQLRPIDFFDLQIGFDVQDLAISCVELDRSASWSSVGFREGYAAVRPLPELDPERLAIFDAGRRLNLMNLGLHKPRSGIARYLEAHATSIASWMS